MREEILDLVEKNIVPSSLFSGIATQGNEVVRPHLTKYEDSFFCPCFNPQENKCKIYLHRPFDCQLYPFVLSQKDNVVYLAAAENCPYTQEVRAIGATEEYIQYLLGILSSDRFLQLAKNNPGLIQNYGQDVAYLFPLPKLSQVIHASSASHPQR
jgi:Fe-S-cluster containining protein